MITLVHILSDATLTGAPAHVLSLVKGLPKTAFTSVIISPEGPMLEQFEKAGFATYKVPLSSKFAMQSIGSIRQVLDMVKNSVQDNMIIHCHGVRAGLLGRLAARSFCVPVIYTEHSWTADYHLPNKMNELVQRSALRLLDRYTTCTVAVSQAVEDFFIERKITSKNKIVTIHNGVKMPDKSLPLLKSSVIGSVGSLTWQKNYSFLIDVMHDIKNHNQDIRLEIIGSGPQREMLEEKIAALGLKGAVKLIGSVAQDKIPIYFSRWGLYIQPSTNESFGLALAEAVVAGLPAVGSRAGSIPEILGDNSHATFLSGNVSDASDLILRLFSDYEERTKLREDEMKSVSQFTIDKMVAGHVALYEKVLRTDH